MGLGKRRFEGKRLQGAEKKVEKLRSRQGDKRQTDGVTGPEMESVRRREGGREREIHREMETPGNLLQEQRRPGCQMRFWT